MRILMALGLTSLALLAGCQSDEQIMKEARARGLEQCNNSPAAKQAAPGFDVSRFCTCLMDKTLNGKTPADIEKMNDSEIKASAERNGAECVAQQTPAPAPAAQQATESAPEAVEEAVDEAE
jgi:hypothetical protein